MINPLGGIKRASRSIAAQMYVAIGIGVALTMVASAVAWIVFGRVADAQRRVNDGSMPDMVAAFGIAQQVAAIADTAPLITAAMTPEELAERSEEVQLKHVVFLERIRSLSARRGESEGLRRVRVWGREMTSNLEQIKDSVARRLELAQLSAELRARVQSADSRLAFLLEAALDDQFFFVMTGYMELGQAPSPLDEHFSADEIHRYRRMAELKEGVDIGSQVLARVFSVPDADLLEPLRERYESSSSQFARSLSAISSNESGLEIGNLFNELYQLAVGEDGAFALRSRELQIQTEQAELLAASRETAADLVNEVQVLVNGFRGSTIVAADASTEAIRTGQQLLLALNVVSLVGAVIIGWLWVGRHLLRRLDRLSSRMRQMAGGDLEAAVEVEGSDEVADMAAALEVFRRHALEVQRLNLVEKLAEDLKAKNSELENVLADLRRAQDQIVVRQKLAALGELTAGVAHEIKNPLNFVKNFSEVSEELLEELLELIPDSDEPMDDEDIEEFEEICDDLTENLQCIRQHGERANRIVHSMLMMGRGSTEKSMTNINSLLKEHAALAYHSARATDPDFNLSIEEQFDQDIGEIECRPQDIGRVILNMVTNACHATDDRRRASDEPYFPTLRLKTARVDGKVQIRIWDNGTGIPAEIKQKIFHPFFTTKDTDKGTGLGLALSNDIVREHGGEVRVESEPNEFTEMIVDLPLSMAPDLT